MKNRLTKEDVLHLSKLVGLNLSNDDVKKITPQLSEIINFFQELKKVDTASVEITSQTTGLKDVLREDKLMSEDFLTHSDVLYNAPDKQNNMFKVPIILKKK